MTGLVWILTTLLAIANLGDWEAVGLAIAVLGGAAVGLAAIVDVRAFESKHSQAAAIEARVRSGWARVAANELWILLLVGPFFLFPRRAFTPLLLLLPILWLVRWRVRGRLTPRTPLDWPILFLLVMLPISLIALADLDRSLPKFFGLLWGHWGLLRRRQLCALGASSRLDCDRFGRGVRWRRFGRLAGDQLDHGGASSFPIRCTRTCRIY